MCHKVYRYLSNSLTFYNQKNIHNNYFTRYKFDFINDNNNDFFYFCIVLIVHCHVWRIGKRYE